MVETDKKEFANAVREVLKSYRQECGSFTLKVWWAALQKHELSAVLNAMGAYCADPDRCKYAPKAGDIVGMIDGNKADKKELAVIAFAKVIENVNSYASVVFDDPAIHYAIAIGFGSWVEVGKYNEAEFKCQEQRRAFVSAYASFKQGTAYLPRMIGTHEQSEASTGHKSFSETLYIGDKQNALAVEDGGRVAVNGSAGFIAGEILTGIKAVTA